MLWYFSSFFFHAAIVYVTPFTWGKYVSVKIPMFNFSILLEFIIWVIKMKLEVEVLIETAVSNRVVRL